MNHREWEGMEKTFLLISTLHYLVKPELLIIELVEKETPEFIPPQQLANSPDLNQVIDHSVWEYCRRTCIQRSSLIDELIEKATEMVGILNSYRRWVNLDGRPRED